MGPERDELHEDLSGTIPTVAFQKLVKDPHNRRKTEGEPKENRRGHDRGHVHGNVHGLFTEMITEMFTEMSTEMFTEWSH